MCISPIKLEPSHKAELSIKNPNKKKYIYLPRSFLHQVCPLMVENINSRDSCQRHGIAHLLGCSMCSEPSAVSSAGATHLGCKAGSDGGLQFPTPSPSGLRFPFSPLHGLKHPTLSFSRRVQNLSRSLLIPQYRVCDEFTASFSSS